MLELDQSQPEFVQTFSGYMKNRMSEIRIRRGKEMLVTHKDLLRRIEQRYGVQPQYLVSFWALESNFGGDTGGFSVINALATLGESAAAGTGTIGASLANTSASATQQAGLDQAAGTTGVNNALTGAANSYLGYQNFQDLLKRFPVPGTNPNTTGYSDPFAGNTMSQQG